MVQSAVMPVRYMTNPAQLMLAGNPRRKRSTTASTTEKPMTRTKHRRKKSRTARVAKHRARRSKRRASRKGKMPAGLAAYWAGKRGAKSNPRRRRSSRKARMSGKRHRRRHKKAKGLLSVIGLNPPHHHHHHKRRRKSKVRARRMKRNPSVKAMSMKLFSGFTHLGSNIKDTFMGGGLKGFAAAAAGAGGAVFAGTMVSRVTNQAVGMVAPKLLQNPFVTRILGAANYYLAGYALAKFCPGISPRTRRGMLTGATIAAIIEGISPGAVRNAAARLPLVGGVFSHTLSGMADGMADYVSYALAGVGNAGSDHNSAVVMDDDVAQDGMADYVTFPALADYVTFG